MGMSWKSEAAIAGALRWGDPAPGKELEVDGYLGLDRLAPNRKTGYTCEQITEKEIHH